MANTTAALVAGIIEVDTSIDLTPFIDTAFELVAEVTASAGYTTTRIELIERWLAAHFYAVRDIRPSSEKAGPVGQNFMYKVGLNLAVTIYGQQAMLLDTVGGLAALSKRAEQGKLKAIGVSWMGTGNTEGDDIST